MPQAPVRGGPARERLVRAAFSLFEEQGYDGTTVEQIAARAGTGRTTFFRHFGSKEEVIFPDHDALLPQVEARLASASAETLQVALREAIRLVLDHYVAEGDTARARYRLTAAVPVLRDRESASVQRYVRLVTRRLRRWLADGEDGTLRAEVMATAAIAAHNHVLRQWLRGTAASPREELDRALDLVFTLDRPACRFPSASAGAGASAGATVIVCPPGQDVARTLEQVRAALTSG